MLAVAEPEVIAVPPDRDERNRSGEHDMGGERWATIRESIASAARQEAQLGQLVVEIKGLRGDMAKQATELDAQKSMRSTEAVALATFQATITGTLTNHSSQLADIWKRFDEKRGAWIGVLPTIIASVVAGLLSSAIVGMLVYNTTKSAPAAAAAASSTVAP